MRRIVRPPAVEKKIAESCPKTWKETCVNCGSLYGNVRPKFFQRKVCSKKCLSVVKKKIYRQRFLDRAKSKYPVLPGKSLKPAAERKDFYSTPEWRSIRYEALREHRMTNGNICLVCNRSNVPFHVDHIKPISKYPHLALDKTNLQVLCEDCNLGKSNTDEIDWRIKKKSKSKDKDMELPNF